MEDDNPYEALPPSSTMTTHMFAGAAAGVLEHSVMYPVDCVKTRMQALVPDPKADYRSLMDAANKIVRYEGLRNTMRGFSAMVTGAGPAHAMYFACYEEVKKKLSGGQQGNHLANGVAGCAATLLHDAVMNPADVVKQRMQVYGSNYRTCLQCMTHVVQREGLWAFYRSYSTQLVMNIPFQTTQFVTYEIMQDLLNNDRAYNPFTHMCSGAVAGAIAASITMPLDVCKTLLNTQETCARTHLTYINGMASAFRTIYEFRGMRGFFQGLTARVVYQIPSTAISWSVYEFFKFVMTHRSHVDDGGYLSAPVSNVNGVNVHAVSTLRAE
ncbi:mitoferrin-2-like isoform X2 [Babylonia areolata]|uniref:mitoferrin-2-like isoform X2 n=1 Tax=Babylonia areolata TaxID=304850 RepID=UPI003FD59346